MDFSVGDPAPAVASNLLSVQSIGKVSKSPLSVDSRTKFPLATVHARAPSHNALILQYVRPLTDVLFVSFSLSPMA